MNNESKKAGRKLKYGEKTILMRVPESMVPQINAMMAKREVIADIAQYPSLIEGVIDAIAEVMNAQGLQMQAILRELFDCYEDMPESDRLKLLEFRKCFDQSLPDPQVTLKAYNSVVRSIFDAAGEASKPDLRLI